MSKIPRKFYDELRKKYPAPIHEGHTRKGSFYLPKGTGKADDFWGPYPDPSVFMATWQTVEPNPKGDALAEQKSLTSSQEYDGENR